MFGNGHVRFLRGCGRAIVQSYLTQQKHKKTNDNPISRKYRKKNNSFEKKKYTNLKKIPLNIQNKHKKIKKETSTHYNVVYPSLTVQFIPDLRGRGVLAKI